jgi:hypothetical protein
MPRMHDVLAAHQSNAELGNKSSWSAISAVHATLVLILATSNDQQAAEGCCLAGQNFMLAARDE